MKLMERLRTVRLEQERVAVSLLALSFFIIQYLLAALSAPVAWRPMLVALALCYGVAFFALASQWFWARWYASGLAWSGTTLGLAALVMVGWHPLFVVYGGLHALVLGMLAGPPMVARFESQTRWRERYGMDDFAVARLRRMVTRASAALPSVLMWALAPREGQGAWFASGVIMVCALAGMTGVLRLRTWGALSLGLSGSLLALAALFPPSTALLGGEGLLSSVPWANDPRLAAAFSAVLLLAAFAPVARNLARLWRSLS